MLLQLPLFLMTTEPDDTIAVQTRSSERLFEEPDSARHRVPVLEASGGPYGNSEVQQDSQICAFSIFPLHISFFIFFSLPL